VVEAKRRAFTDAEAEGTLDAIIREARSRKRGPALDKWKTTAVGLLRGGEASMLRG